MMFPKWSKEGIVLAVVVYTNFLDYLLLTAVVPIIPEYLVEVDSKDALLESDNNVTVLFDNETDIFLRLNDTVKDVKPEQVKSLAFLEKVLHIPIRAINENSKVGWLLGSKALVQMVANPIVGYLSNRISYRNLLLFGTSVFLVSSTVFAAAESLVPLLIARSLQGVGSAATTIAGMSMIAENYVDDKARSRAMGVAMGGLALGILVGYPYGGLLYAISGKVAPFVGIGIMCAINIGLQVKFLEAESSISKVEIKSSSLYKLLVDPYIVICAGAIMVTSMSLAVLESTVPLWIIDTMDAQQWQLGLIFVPDSVGYLFGTNGFPVVARKYGRWIFTIVSLMAIGLGMIAIPFCTELSQLLIPHLALGLGVGVTDAAIMPMLALLVDQRHVSTYGSVYAIVQLAVCLAYSLGPAIAGYIVKTTGFKWSMWGMSILNMTYAPLCLFLKSPPVDDEVKGLLDEVAPPIDEIAPSVESKMAPSTEFNMAPTVDAKKDSINLTYQTFSTDQD